MTGDLTLRLPSDVARDRAVVTVAMPAHNSARYVVEAMRSILDQTHHELILHVHDDGSTDETLGRVLSVQDERLLVTAGAQSGAARSRNLIARQAKTEFLAMMDSDDRSTPHRLERQICWLREHPDAGVVSSAMRAFGPRAPGVFDTPERSHARVLAFLLQGAGINFGPATGRTTHWQDFPGKEHLRAAEDYDIMCRMAVGGVRMHLLPDVHYDYRHHDANTIFAPSTGLRENTDSIKRWYHSHVLEGAGAARFTAWMVWASEDHSPGITDPALMDSTLLMALGRGLHGVDSSVISRTELRHVAREIAVRQYERRAGLASAAMLPLVLRRLGVRQAAVGAKRIVTSKDRPIRGRGRVDHPWPGGQG